MQFYGNANNIQETVLLAFFGLIFHTFQKKEKKERKKRKKKHSYTFLHLASFYSKETPNEAISMSGLFVCSIASFHTELQSPPVISPASLTVTGGLHQAEHHRAANRDQSRCFPPNFQLVAACDKLQEEHDSNQSWQPAAGNIFVRALIKLSAGILEQMQSV